MTIRMIPWAALVVVLAVSGCGGSSPLQPHVPSVATDQQATCRAAKDPANPLIVEWPGTSRTALSAASQRGLVIVSYQGCVMKVLQGCDAGGRYQMSHAAASAEKLVIDNEDKLYAELPLGVARLKGYLEHGSRLTLEYVSVGQQVADGVPLALQGGAACDGATHYVRAMTMGAFSLDAGAASAAGADVGVAVGGLGAGGTTRSSVENLRSGGDLAACKADGASVRCDAVLQLAVMPLPKQMAASKDEGFGRGLGGLAALPTVGAMRELEGASDLAKADVALLELLQAATRIEKDEKTKAFDKAVRWRNVAEYAGENSFRTAATKRAEDWGRVAVAEARRATKAKRVCDSQATDSTKLARVLAIDDEVVDKAQKASFQREYDRAYDPFKDILTDCEGWRVRAAEPWVATVLELQAQTDKNDAERTGAERKLAAETGERDRNTRERPTRTLKTVGIVSGAVLIVGGATALVVGASLWTSANKECVNGACPAESKSETDTANLVGTVGLVAAGAGVAALLAGLLWPLPQPPRTDARLRLAPGPGVGASTVVGF